MQEENNQIPVQSEQSNNPEIPVTGNQEAVQNISIQDNLKQVIADLDDHIKVLEELKKDPTSTNPAMNYDEMLAVLRRDKEIINEKLEYFNNNSDNDF